MGGQIRTERDGALGWLIFDQPERRNAVSVEMWRQLPGAIAELETDDAVRVIVLRGAGEEAFVSGADISEFEDRRMGTTTRDYDADSGRGFGALAAIAKPVLAMIYGPCVGGGAAISLAADLRFASDDAVFAIPAARLGLGYGLGGFENLAQLVGLANAKEIFFTARRFSADEALRMGLVNAVVPRAELESHVRRVAERIGSNAPLTVRSLKLISREVAKPAEARDLQAVSRAVRACFESEDYREGVRAFMEKRRPDFKGR